MRHLIHINLTSNQPEFANAMCTRLVDAGYKTHITITDDCDTGIFVGNAFRAEAEEIFRIRALIAPLSLSIITLDSDLDYFEVAIHLGIADPITDGIEIVCPESMRNVLKKKAEALSLDAIIKADNSETHPAIFYRHNAPAAAHLAWQFDMPAETRLIYDPALSCAARIHCTSEEALQRQRRRLEPISIRSSDANSARAYAEYLETLGYRTQCLLIDPDEGKDGFGTIICNYTKRAAEMPAFQWLMKDLKEKSESWLQSNGINISAYPFESPKQRYGPAGMHSIVVDLPFVRAKSGELHPYGEGYAGRYAFCIHTPEPESERVKALEIFLTSELGINNISVRRSLRVQEYSVTFGKEVMADIRTQKHIASTLHQFLAKSCNADDLRVFRSLAKHDITIHLPSEDMPDRSSLKIRVESNDPPVIDWIAHQLEKAGHDVDRVYATGLHRHELSIAYGVRTTSEEVTAIEKLIRPLHLVWREAADDSYDIIIRMMVDLRDSQRSVQIFAPRTELIEPVHARLSTKGFGVVRTGIRDVEHFMVADGTGCRSTTAYIAWIAGMPAESAFVDGKDEGPFTSLYLAEPSPGDCA